jgi:hypothetical protein
MASAFLRFPDHAQQWRTTVDRTLWTSQRPLPDNTQLSQWTNIHASGGMRTHNLSRRLATDPHRRPHGHCYLPWKCIQARKQEAVFSARKLFQCRQLLVKIPAMLRGIFGTVLDVYFRVVIIHYFCSTPKDVSRNAVWETLCPISLK